MPFLIYSSMKLSWVKYFMHNSMHNHTLRKNEYDERIYKSADEAIYHDEAEKRILFLTLKEKATQ